MKTNWLKCTFQRWLRYYKIFPFYKAAKNLFICHLPLCSSERFICKAGLLYALFSSIWMLLQSLRGKWIVSGNSGWAVLLSRNLHLLFERYCMMKSVPSVAGWEIRINRNAVLILLDCVRKTLFTTWIKYWFFHLCMSDTDATGDKPLKREWIDFEAYPNLWRQSDRWENITAVSQAKFSRHSCVSWVSFKPGTYSSRQIFDNIKEKIFPCDFYVIWILARCRFVAWETSLKRKWKEKIERKKNVFCKLLLHHLFRPVHWHSWLKMCQNE